MAATAVTPHYRDDAAGVASSAAASAMRSSTTNSRAVTFGFGTLKTPQPNPSAPAAGASEETLRQYSQYRSAPDQFPSYDRMRFVRLPQDWLPAGLRGPQARGDDEMEDGQQLLQHWPALVYNNLAELVRDLSPLESKILKAKLILEHRKAPRTVVARLLAWNSSGGSAASSNGSLFEETKLELIRLSGSNLEENEENYGELMSFVDGQLELESVCDGILQGKQSSGDDDGEVVQHALQFRKAVDMALNCLAIDVGADPLPARCDDDEDDQQLAMVVKAPYSNNGRAAAKKPISKQQTKSAFSVEKGSKPSKSSSMAKNMKKKALAHRQGRSMSPMRKSAKGAYYETAAGDKENQSLSSANSVAYSMSNTQSRNEPRKFIAKAAGLKPHQAKVSSPKMTVPAKKTFQPSPAQAKLVARAKKKKKKSKQAKKPISCPNRTVTSNPPQFNRQPMPKKPASAQAIGAPAFSFNDDDDDEEDEDDTPWKDVWAAMKKSGWTWRGGSGLMTDYYYIKPGCKIKAGIEGRDYFISVQGAQTYAQNVHGWGRVSREKLMANIDECAKYAGEIVPLLKEGEEIEPNEEWRDVWDKMLASGWTWRPGSGLMVDYHYVKPGSNIKGGVVGRDYFCNEKDVQKFAVRNYGWRNGKQGLEEKADEVLGVGKRRSSGGRPSDEHQAQEKRQKIEPAAEKLADIKAAKKQPQVIDLVEDRDDDESISDTRSTYSQSGFQTSNKTLFINERADENVPPLKYRIEPNEPWRDAWETMRNSGWSWTVGSGLMTDYYYIKPGCKVKGGIKGQDYFITEEGAKKFAMRNYGWRGEGADLGLGGNSPDKSPNKRRRKSTEKGETEKKRSKGDSLPISKTSKDKALALRAQKAIKAKAPKQAAAKAPVQSNTYDKKALWQALQKDGWRVISAGKYNNLHDWYYVRPGCNPGDDESKLGVDYFLSEDDAIKSAKPSSGMGEAAKEKLTEKFDSARKSSKATKSNGLLTPDDCQTKPQDPAVPLLPSPQVSCKSATTDEDYYQWNNLWPILERAGWNTIKAGRYNPLHDWYYVRPSRHPGDGSSKLGRHFFTCEQDVIAFAKRLDKESSRKGGKKMRKSRDNLGVIQESFEEEARSVASAAVGGCVAS